MSSIAEKRMTKELAESAKSAGDISVPTLLMVNDQILDLRGHFIGPPDTPYANGSFDIEVKIPSTYPFNPPKCRFITRIWHPNISSVTGAICLDILKDQWAASMTVRTVLISIQALLAAPQPDDPQDAVVANQYMERFSMFEKTAKYWTQHYATKGPITDPEMLPWKEKVDQLTSMLHIDQSTALSALSQHGWEINGATQSLL